VARFHVQFQLLHKLGWWERVEGWESASVKVLLQCEQRSPELHIQMPDIPKQVSEKRLLQCFWEIADWLLSYLPKQVETLKSDLSDFGDQSPIISEYLSRAIVPSTISIDGELVHPSANVLINSAFYFYLENLSTLLANVQGVDQASVESRSRFTERLELWVLKSLEDNRLLTRQVL
jgi:hypothetical protein